MASASGLSSMHRVDRRPALIDRVDAGEILLGERMRGLCSVAHSFRRSSIVSSSRANAGVQASARRSSVNSAFSCANGAPVLTASAADAPAPMNDRREREPSASGIVGRHLLLMIRRVENEASDVLQVVDARFEHDEHRVDASHRGHRRIEAIMIIDLEDVLGRDIRQHTDRDVCESGAGWYADESARGRHPSRIERQTNALSVPPTPLARRCRIRRGS